MAAASCSDGGRHRLHPIFPGASAIGPRRRWIDKNEARILERCEDRGGSVVGRCHGAVSFLSGCATRVRGHSGVEPAVKERDDRQELESFLLCHRAKADLGHVSRKVPKV